MTTILAGILACATTGCGDSNAASSEKPSIENVVSSVESKEEIKAEKEGKVYGEVVDKYFSPGEENTMLDYKIPAGLHLTINSKGYLFAYNCSNDYEAKKANKKFKIGYKGQISKKGTSNLKQLSFTKNFLNPNKNIREKSNANNKNMMRCIIKSKRFSPGEENPMLDYKIPAGLHLTVVNSNNTIEYNCSNDYISKKANKIYKTNDVIYLHKKSPNIKYLN